MPSSLGSSPHVRGAPTTDGATTSKRWDHPRMCGEHTETSWRTCSHSGSSPHVRGALALALAQRNDVGIIPACAGSTIGDGEGSGQYIGSSPHVRGARLTTCRAPCSQGIIPACAGSTRGPRSCRRSGRDHPRMCGEHHARRERTSPPMGSSPHVRGALLQNHSGNVHRGIIPACAGSTLYLLNLVRVVGDHPRMCGEHFPVRLHGERRRGIIPACAGST